ncbi:MAG TPA: CAP domain-containing protein [Lacunisphaera sp.]|nr:CAP domain-containing protein [Lacunisphaera sp.]
MRAITSFLLVLVLLSVGLATTSPRQDEKAAEESPRQPELQGALEIGSYRPALMASAIFQETNRVRRRAGLRPFRSMPKLDEAADLQAGIGALLPGVDHHNPFPGLGDIADRVHAVGLEYTLLAENIALTMTLDVTDVGGGVTVEGRDANRHYTDEKTGRTLVPLTYAGFAAVVVKQWMDSPGHRANILNPQLRYLGCSAHWRHDYTDLDTLYSVQVFMTP